METLRNQGKRVRMRITKLHVEEEVMRIFQRYNSIAFAGKSLISANLLARYPSCNHPDMVDVIVTQNLWLGGSGCCPLKEGLFDC